MLIALKILKLILLEPCHLNKNTSALGKQIPQESCLIFLSAGGRPGALILNPLGEKVPSGEAEGQLAADLQRQGAVDGACKQRLGKEGVLQAQAAQPSIQGGHFPLRP